MSSDDSFFCVGVLALVGGREWEGSYELDSYLLELSPTSSVTILLTAAVYQRPEHLLHKAEAWYGSMQARVIYVPILGRSDADSTAYAQLLEDAGFIYIADGSSLHLRSVLKDSPSWQAIIDAFTKGAVLAASGAAASALLNPMVDPRGGALTVGLGLIEEMAMMPHYVPTLGSKAHRTIALAPIGLPIAAIPDHTALVYQDKSTWKEIGSDHVSIFRGGELVGLDALATKIPLSTSSGI